MSVKEEYEEKNKLIIIYSTGGVECTTPERIPNGQDVNLIEY